MKIWGSIDVPQRIEFISYSSVYHDQVLDVIRNTFFLYETVNIGCKVDENFKAQKELEVLCSKVLKQNFSIIERDVENYKVVGVALNLIQVKSKN